MTMMHNTNTPTLGIDTVTSYYVENEAMNGSFLFPPSHIMYHFTYLIFQGYFVALVAEGRH